VRGSEDTIKEDGLRRTLALIALAAGISTLAASPAGAKQSSCESGFVATGNPNRSAIVLVSGLASPPTGNSERDNSRCPSMWSM